MDSSNEVAAGIFTSAFAGGMCFIWLLVVVLIIAGWWKLFDKAGQPGWAAIIPFFNAIVLLQIARRPVWWFVLFFIPFLNLIPVFVIPFDMAKHFGKSTGYGIGLLLVPVIFYPMLGFGDAVYDPRD